MEVSGIECWSAMCKANSLIAVLSAEALFDLQYLEDNHLDPASWGKEGYASDA